MLSLFYLASDKVIRFLSAITYTQRHTYFYFFCIFGCSLRDGQVILSNHSFACISPRYASNNKSTPNSPFPISFQRYAELHFNISMPTPTCPAFGTPQPSPAKFTQLKTPLSPEVTYTTDRSSRLGRSPFPACATLQFSSKR